MIKQIISIFIINLIVNSYFSLLNSVIINLNSSIIILLYDLFSKKSRNLIFLNIFSLVFYYLFGFLCNNFLFVIFLYYINYNNLSNFFDIIKILFLNPFLEYFDNKKSSYFIIKNNYDKKEIYSLLFRIISKIK